MSINELGSNLLDLILSIGGVVAIFLGQALYSIIKKYLSTKLTAIENKSEEQARDLFSKFSATAYDAVEQLKKQGLVDDKASAFDKLFKENFPDVDDKLVKLFREAEVGKRNENRLEASPLIKVEAKPDLVKVSEELATKAKREDILR